MGIMPSPFKRSSILYFKLLRNPPKNVCLLSDGSSELSGGNIVTGSHSSEGAAITSLSTPISSKSKYGGVGKGGVPEVSWSQIDK